MSTRVIIKQTSGMRSIDDAEVHKTFDDSRPSVTVEVPMSQFDQAIGQGNWHGQSSYLKHKSDEILEQVQQASDPELHYFGLAEVPHIVALGAFLGGRRFVTVHDPMDRENPSWRWPSNESRLELTYQGLEAGRSSISAPGTAVISVSISAPVLDADIADAVGDSHLAKVTIKPTCGLQTFGLVRCGQDVDHFRAVFQDAYSMLREQFPNISVVHIFVAAPPSICFTLGQALDISNGPTVQTYRFRSASQPRQIAALRLDANDNVPPQELTAEEKLQAETLRQGPFSQAVKEVDDLMERLQQTDSSPQGEWFNLDLPELAKTRPFPSLPTLGGLCNGRSSVDAVPCDGFYEYDLATRHWKVGDRMLLGFSVAVEHDLSAVGELLRLFLFHEYLHKHHSIVRETAPEVGKFANCLEYLDYQADVYALIHQLALTSQNGGPLSDIQGFMKTQIDMLLKSLWVFVERPIQTRAIRRLFNWYWRLAQVESCGDAARIYQLLNKPPHIELAGMQVITDRRRVMMNLDKRDLNTALEIAIVLENDVLKRVSSSPGLQLEDLVELLKKGDHEAIKSFFKKLLTTIEIGSHGRVLPVKES